MRSTLRLGGALLAAAVLLPLHADTRKDPTKGSLFPIAPESSIEAGNIRYTMPFSVPTPKDVLAALPADTRPLNPRIECKLVHYRVDEPRFYPLVGIARL